MEFKVPANHREWKKSEKIDRKLDLVKELKKLLKMKIIAIRIVVGGNGPQKAWKKDWKNWKSEKESRPPRPQFC